MPVIFKIVLHILYSTAHVYSSDEVCDARDDAM